MSEDITNHILQFFIVYVITDIYFYNLDAFKS